MSLKAILYCDFEVKKRDKKSTGKSSLFISQILKINLTLVKNRGPKIKVCPWLALQICMPVKIQSARAWSFGRFSLSPYE